jgi:hypothetical protein
MIAWYYAKDGRQNGPVSLEELIRLRATGTITSQDLVWREGMDGWKPAGEVAELDPPPASPPPLASQPPSGAAWNPYQTSTTTWPEPGPERVREEIVPGSDPIVIGDCIRRAFDLTKRHFWMLLAVGVVYSAVIFAFNFTTTLAISPFTKDRIESRSFPPVEYETGRIRRPGSDMKNLTPAGQVAEALQSLAAQVLDLFLGLGMARIGLNFVSGKPVEIGMLFGEGRKLWTCIGASILYGLMVAVGLVLLIVPGIYLALRFGQYQNAIVDKDLGVIDSLKYSSRITEGNKMNLLGLGVICFLIVIAGVLALLVGLFLALPVVYLASFVAFRWMQYGRASLQD